MKKVVIFTIVFALFYSSHSIAEQTCTAAYQDYRNRITEHQGIPDEAKDKYLQKLMEAEKLCKEGKIKEAEKIIEELKHEAALDKVFDTFEGN